MGWGTGGGGGGEAKTKLICLNIAIIFTNTIAHYCQWRE